MFKTWLQKISKGSDSTVNYLGHLKTLIDKLIVIGKLVSYKDHLAHMLKGLPVEYDPFVSIIYNQVDNPIVEEVQSLLVLYEIQL